MNVSSDDQVAVALALRMKLQQGLPPRLCVSA